jgi:hypothetical protein
LLPKFKEREFGAWDFPSTFDVSTLIRAEAVDEHLATAARLSSSSYPAFR